MKNLYTPSHALDLLPGKRVLVLAPHPDDEVFGCGGTLALMAASGAEIQIIVVTDGAARATNCSETTAIREIESRAAAAMLGLAAPIFWRLPDGGLRYDEKLVMRIAQALAEWQADIVLAPSALESHSDHYALALTAAEVVRRHPNSITIAFYEVGVPLWPNMLVDISPVLHKKQAAMVCFKSELRFQAYDEHIAALNRYRTYTLPRTVTAAEAFLVIDSETLKHDWLAIFTDATRQRHQAGLPVRPDVDVPLISILIRSMDRPTLAKALDSVALQTWGNLEIVVVAACPNHTSLPDHWQHMPLRMIPTDRPLTRTVAANVALVAAKGKYCLFLDDDDWLAPDHITKLAQEARTRPGCLAIHTDIACVDAEGKLTGITFDNPCDPTRLMAFNHLPIHAVLFDRRLVADGCIFDETLDIYEDWDFWLQVTTRTEIAHISGVSGFYRIHTSSGVHQQEPFEGAAYQVIYQKWRNRWSADQWAQLMRAIWSDRDCKATLHHSRNEVELLRAERDAMCAERDAMCVSTSWKITQPLRTVAHQIKQARRIVELPMGTIKRAGGLINTLRKTIQLYRREGLAGIRRAFRIVASSSQVRPASNSGEFDRNNYAEWIHRYDTLTDETRAALRSRIGFFDSKPLISVVMPAYNPNPEWLIEAIESVRNQIYSNWELCIADDASTNPSIRPILERYAQEDSRIKVIFRAQNGHISAASNSALELAGGEWVALMDHDDLLAEHALFWVADAINQRPDIRLIYSDEDKIDEAGKRSAPYFKCDWNVDLFYSHNLISHLGVYHKDLLHDIGGFREGLEGSQDYDLALRCIELIEPNQIHHVPRVLYHWRMHAESTAQSNDAKPYAMLAGERAIDEHFKRQNIEAKSEFLGYGYRVRYALPEKLPLVSLIIQTRNGLELIKQCIESILAKTTYSNYEIIVVDNGSDDPKTLKYFGTLKAETRVRIVRDDRPFNYSALNNAAAKLARGEVLGLLNNNLKVTSPGWLSEMVSIALQPKSGAVGARLLYPDNSLQHGGVILGIGGVAGHAHKHILRGQFGYFGRAHLIQSLSAVTAACLVVKKNVFEEVAGFNEVDLQVAFNDVDFCLRVREAGYRNVWTPYAELYHHESATRGYENTPEKQARFASEVQYMKQRWGNSLLNDPAYSPNLTLDFEDFSFAWPPRIDSQQGRM